MLEVSEQALEVVGVIFEVGVMANHVVACGVEKTSSDSRALA